MGTLARSKTRATPKAAAAEAPAQPAPVAAPETRPVETAHSFGTALGRAGRQATETTEHETQVVTFQLGNEEYAIDILQVQEIVMMTEITRMPKAPRFIEGIVNLRGQMIPIIDMRKRFDLAEGKHDSDTRIIIVDIGHDLLRCYVLRG